MTKLKSVQAYPTKDVPDHMVHECQECGKEIVLAISKVMKSKNYHPNILLGGLGFAHAAFIKQMISDDPEELKKGTALFALALIKNVEHLANLKILGEE